MSSQHSNPLQENDTQFNEAVLFGAEQDSVNVGNLFKWTVITIIFVLGLIYTGFQLYTYFTYTTAESQAISTTYEILDTYKMNNEKRLSSYGIVNEDNGIYHLPIEKAIDLTVDAYTK